MKRNSPRPSHRRNPDFHRNVSFHPSSGSHRTGSSVDGILSKIVDENMPTLPNLISLSTWRRTVDFISFIHTILNSITSLALVDASMDVAHELL